MGDYRKLFVWRRSHDFVVAVYRTTSRFPPEEKFGMTSQLRRAAASIALNIAEGASRRTDADQAHFLSVARASANEVECALLLARDLGMLAEVEYEPLMAEVGQVSAMLAGWLRTNQRKRRGSSQP